MTMAFGRKVYQEEQGMRYKRTLETVGVESTKHGKKESTRTPKCGRLESKYGQKESTRIPSSVGRGKAPHTQSCAGERMCNQIAAFSHVTKN